MAKEESNKAKEPKKRKEITHRFFVDMGDGVDIPWENFSDEQKKEISIRLNDQAMRAIGLRRVDKDKTA